MYPWSRARGDCIPWPVLPVRRRAANLARRLREANLRLPQPVSRADQLLARLIELGYPVIVSVAATDIDGLRRFHAPNLRFECRPIDLKQVASQCDLVMLNGNHGTTISMLLAGKPTLQIPIFLEQTLNAVTVKRLGAGLIASSSRPPDIFQKLSDMLDSDRYAEAARGFAARYADFNPQRQIEAMVEGVEQLLT